MLSRNSPPEPPRTRSAPPHQLRAKRLINPKSEPGRCNFAPKPPRTCSAPSCHPPAKRPINPRSALARRPASILRRLARRLFHRPCGRPSPPPRQRSQSLRRKFSTWNCPCRQPKSILKRGPRRDPGRKSARVPGPKPSRAQKDPPEALLKTLENIPRSLRLARGEIVRIRLGKEEAGQLFARPPQRPQQGREAQNATRAVSIRLSAPEGGFFIETMTPETQWLPDSANSPGEEPFGNWSWAVVPNETGWRILLISFCVRDIDASGALNGSQVTEQALKIRVGANFGRLFWGSASRAALADCRRSAGRWRLVRPENHGQTAFLGKQPCFPNGRLLKVSCFRRVLSQSWEVHLWVMPEGMLLGLC